MKVLVSAYACEPGKGSEPEVGLRTVLAAATEHEVWVLTRDNNIPSLSSFFQSHPLGSRVHLVGVGGSNLSKTIKRFGIGGMHWFYDRWQLRAAKLALELDRLSTSAGFRSKYRYSYRFSCTLHPANADAHSASRAVVTMADRFMFISSPGLALAQLATLI